MDRNALDQPIGAPVLGWSRRPLPSRTVMAGRYVNLEPLEPARHAQSLFDANAQDVDGGMWTYMSYGPFASFAAYREFLEKSCSGADPLFFALVDRASERAVGVASYLRIDPDHGAIEIGHIALSPLIQRTTAATEAMFLMIERAFDGLGYRRMEWKCNALNAPSRAAALRLGFRFEGIFRQSMIVKGRNRDTAWFAILDSEWPSLRARFQRWSDLENFDADGRQRRSLSAFG